MFISLNSLKADDSRNGIEVAAMAQIATRQIEWTQRRTKHAKEEV